jgi:hypothetical protein
MLFLLLLLNIVIVFRSSLLCACTLLPLGYPYSISGEGLVNANTRVWNAAPTSPTSSGPVAGGTVGEALDWPGLWRRVFSPNWRLRRPELEARGSVAQLFGLG